ncbi:MAG: SRPBCC family protein [Actinomycetota bacterium]|nr:SRPBCC family protein [Actinomycetota bacterium]
MTPTIASTMVDRPAAQVFAYATDPARFSEWQQGVIDGHLDQPGPPQVGAKCLTTRRIGGASRVVTSEFTHIDVPRTWGVRGIDGPIRATVDVTVEPVTAASSRLTIAVDFDGHGIGKLLVPLIVRRQAQKEMPANVEALKRRVEAQEPQGPAQDQATCG